jgi:hypothetical protein
MMGARQFTRAVATAAALATMTACAQTGGLGNILGGVLAPQPMEASGTIQGVDTRYQQLSLQQSNGQTVNVGYDNRTQVVYQNQLYPVTSLEYGDQVVARLIDNGNNGYYTDSIYVSQPVNSSNGGVYGGGMHGGVLNGGTGTTGNATVQSMQGTVSQIDRTNGRFTVNTGNNVMLTVTLPYNANSQDVNRFNNLRSGDYVRFYGVFVTNSRVELRQFY